MILLTDDAIFYLDGRGQVPIHKSLFWTVPLSFYDIPLDCNSPGLVEAIPGHQLNVAPLASEEAQAIVVATVVRTSELQVSGKFGVKKLMLVWCFRGCTR